VTVVAGARLGLVARLGGRGGGALVVRGWTRVVRGGVVLRCAVRGGGAGGRIVVLLPVRRRGDAVDEARRIGMAVRVDARRRRAVPLGGRAHRGARAEGSGIDLGFVEARGAEQEQQDPASRSQARSHGWESISVDSAANGVRLGHAQMFAFVTAFVTARRAAGAIRSAPARGRG